MAFSLALIVAVLSARRIQSVWFPSKQAQTETAEEDEGYYPFVTEAEKKDTADSQTKDKPMMIELAPEAAFMPEEKEMQKPFFGGQIDLPALAREQEAYRLSQSPLPEGKDIEHFKNEEEILPDFSRYANAPELENFAKDMQKAMAEAGLTPNIPPHEMVDKILKNPQMQKILLEYSKDPKIMSVIDEMISGRQSRNNATLKKTDRR